VVSDANPSVYGGAITLTATVTPTAGAGTPTGPVVFSDSGTFLGSVTLDPTGTATFPTSSLIGGSHTITATYGGDGFFVGSAGSMTQVVNKAATSTVVVSNFNPSVEGLPVTFTATVSAAAATLAPSGTVQFFDGATLLGTGTVTGGVASLVTPFSVAGSHSITAAYVGDGNYLGSTSPAITQTVLRATTTVVTSNRVPSANPGQSITFTATVRPVTGTGFPTTGTVEFRENGTLLGTGVYIGTGRWTFSTNTLTAGSHTIAVSFLGSGSFAASSGSYTQVVNLLATTTVVTSSVNPSVFGQSVTFTARVQPNPATGSILFTIDGQAPVSQTLDTTGRARLTTNALGAGPHTVTAFYPGAVNYAPSTSTAFNQTVNKSNTRTVVTTSLTPAPVGTTVSFTVTVTPRNGGAGVPQGNVDLSINGASRGVVALNSSGQVVYPITGLAIGNYTVSAVYAGDGNFNTSTSASITQRIR